MNPTKEQLDETIGELLRGEYVKAFTRKGQRIYKAMPQCAPRAPWPVWDGWWQLADRLQAFCKEHGRAPTPADEWMGDDGGRAIEIMTQGYRP